MYDHREHPKCRNIIIQRNQVSLVSMIALLSRTQLKNSSCLLGVYCYSVRLDMHGIWRNLIFSQGSRLILNLRVAAEGGSDITTSTAGPVKMHGLEIQFVPRGSSGTSNSGSTDVEMDKFSRLR